MRLPSTQRGMGALNLMYVLITLAIFGYVGLKLFPMYLENLKIERAIKAVAASPSAASQTPKELAFAIVKRLEIDYVTRITERNWNEYLDIKKRNERVTINASYTSEVPLFFNLAVVASFENSSEGG